MEQNLARDVKNNKKKLYMQMSQKRKARESVPLINEKGEQVTKNLERAEAPSEFFASVFTDSQASPFSQAPLPPGGGWGNEVPPSVRKEQVQDHLMKDETE